ncbi:MAG: hypothetical protein ABI042_14215 [Verrucomicrobiota bacterium]
MKKLAIIILGICLAGTVTTLSAKDKAAKHEGAPTEEQKAMRKELLEKYDTNKDGKLDKEEKSKISAEDKEKAKKAGMGAHKKKESSEATEKKADDDKK